MDAVTYPNPEVAHLIEEHFVPVQFNVVEQADVMDQFNTPWTPTLIVQDAEGREHRRSNGYLDPKRFQAEMAVARLVAAVNRGDFRTAVAHAGPAQRLNVGDPWREPEALYWSGVAAYKDANDPNLLLAAWNRILDQFSQSEWARKVEFIRQ
jgi:hypothetical protein